MQGGQDRGNYLTQMGNANAANYMAQGNALNNAIGQGVNAYQNNQMMNKLNMYPQQPGVTTVATGADYGGYA